MISNFIGQLHHLLKFLVSNQRGAGLARGGVGSLSLKLLHAGLTLLLAVLLARLLGPTQYGIYSFAFALITLLAVPLQMGLPLLLVRETAKGRARSDAKLVYGIWRWSVTIVLVGSVLVILIGAILLFAGWRELSHATRWSFFWGLLVIPLIALGSLHGAALRGLDRVVLGQLPDYVMRLGFLATILLLWWLWSQEFTAPRAMAFHVVAGALALAISHIFLRRCRTAEIASSNLEKWRPRSWLKSMLPLGFIAATQVINTRADTLLLGLLTDAESVGLYQVAVQGAQAVAFGLGSINLVAAPHFAGLHEQRLKQKLQRLVTLSGRTVLLIALLVVVSLVLSGEVLIMLIFGLEYRMAYLPLMILAVGQLANAGFGLAGMLLTMTGHEIATARGMALTAGLNIALNLVLIPIFGIGGAAAATALSMALLNLILWKSARRLLDIDTLAFRRTQSERV